MITGADNQLTAASCLAAEMILFEQPKKIYHQCDDGGAEDLEVWYDSGASEYSIRFQAKKPNSNGNFSPKELGEIVGNEFYQDHLNRLKQNSLAVVKYCLVSKGFPTYIHNLKILFDQSKKMNLSNTEILAKLTKKGKYTRETYSKIREKIEAVHQLNPSKTMEVSTEPDDFLNDNLERLDFDDVTINFIVNCVDYEQIGTKREEKILKQLLTQKGYNNELLSIISHKFMREGDWLNRAVLAGEIIQFANTQKTSS